MLEWRAAWQPLSVERFKLSHSMEGLLTLFPCFRVLSLGSRCHMQAANWFVRQTALAAHEMVCLRAKRGEWKPCLEKNSNVDNSDWDVSQMQEKPAFCAVIVGSAACIMCCRNADVMFLMLYAQHGESSLLLWLLAACAAFLVIEFAVLPL